MQLNDSVRLQTRVYVTYICIYTQNSHQNQLWFTVYKGKPFMELQLFLLFKVAKTQWHWHGWAMPYIVLQHTLYWWLVSSALTLLWTFSPFLKDPDVLRGGMETWAGPDAWRPVIQWTYVHNRLRTIIVCTTNGTRRSILNYVMCRASNGWSILAKGGNGETPFPSFPSF